MSTAEKLSTQNTITENDVLAWVLENPDFLTKYAAKLAAAQPQKTENVTPLHAVRAKKAEHAHAKLEQRQQKLVRTAEANSMAAATLFDIIPTLIACKTLACVRKCLQKEVKSALDINAARLMFIGTKATATTLRKKDIITLTDGKAVRLRTLYTTEDKALYGTTGKMMKSDALLQLKHEGKLIGLLALGSHDETRFHLAQGTELAAFFGKTISSILSSLK